MSSKSGRVSLLQLLFVNSPHHLAKALLYILLLGVLASPLENSIAIAQQPSETAQTESEAVSPVAAFTVEGELNENSERLADDNSYYTVHEFQGVAGQQVMINLVSTEFDAYLHLIDPEGNKVSEDDDGGGNSNARIIATLPATGTYRIIVNTYVDEVGSYTLSLRATIPEDLISPEVAQSSVQIRDIPFSINGNLDENSDRLPDDGSYYNIYELQGQAGQQIVIDLSSDEFDTVLFLFDSTGKKLAEDNDGSGSTNAQIVLTLPTTGIYGIIANSLRPGATGDYTLSIRAATPEDLKIQEVNQLGQRVGQLMLQGQYTEALPLAQQLLQVAEQLLGENDSRFIAGLSNLAILYHLEGSFEESEQVSQRVLGLVEQYKDELNLDEIAASSFPLMLLYFTQGRYTEAESLLQQALQILDQPKNTSEFAWQALFRGVLGQIYVVWGKYTEAETLLQQALQDQQQTFGTENPFVAQTLNGLATLRLTQGKYEEAEMLLQQALQIQKQVFQTENIDIGVSLRNLALVYLLQGKYAEAEPLFHQSLQILERILSPNHPILVPGLIYLATLNLSQGKFEESEFYFQRALQISEQEVEQNHVFKAQIFNNLATLYLIQGKIKESELSFRQALQNVEQGLGVEHILAAQSYAGLAVLAQIQGNSDWAESNYDHSLQILEQTVGLDHPFTATNLNLLNLLYTNQDSYREAEALPQRAQQIQEQFLERDNPDASFSLFSQAMLYQRQGNYQEAETLLQQALQSIQETLGSEHFFAALIFNALGVTYESKHEFQEAESSFQEAKRIAEKALGAESNFLASVLNNLALVYQYQDRYQEAESLLQQSLNITENLLGSENPGAILILNNLALVYQAQEEYEKAELFYRRALQIAEKKVGTNNSTVATVVGNLALLYQVQGNIEQALNSLKQTVEIEESNLSNMMGVGSELRKQRFMMTIASTTDYTISLHLQSAFDNPEAAHLAFTTVLQRKGRILEAMTNQFQSLRQQADPQTQQLLDKLQSAQNQLANLPRDLPSEQYRSESTRLSQEIDQLQNTLAQRSTEFRLVTQPIGTESIQALIPPNAKLIELVRYEPFNPKAIILDEKWGDDRYAAYILNAQGEIHWADLGEAAPIDELIQQFRTAAQRESYLLDQNGSIPRQLDALLMQPIRPLLDNATHLLISPDSQLNLLPFAALLDEQQHYLIENYTITYLSSGRDLLRLQTEVASQQPPFIFAHPDYGQLPQATASASNQSENSNRRSRDSIDSQFGELPYTENEANAIAPLLPGATVLINQQATVSALKQLQAPSILHMATHGFFLPDEASEPGTQSANPSVSVLENPLLRSGLAFAGANLPPTTPAGSTQANQEDGLLTALEASSLNLRGTKLVVMSACETGLGDIRNGEGVYGLRRAIVLAGAESQIMSLWGVEDDSTRNLMSMYYQNLNQGMGRSEALRQAQLSMLKGDNSNWRNPVHWAAFTFSGDWSPLRDSPN